MEEKYIQRQNAFHGGKENFLSQLLWEKYVSHRDEPSRNYLVVRGNCLQFKKGMVYPFLNVMSSIHPSNYVELTWGEFYRWYGDWKCPESEFVQDGIRTTEEIIKEHDESTWNDVLKEFDNFKKYSGDYAHLFCLLKAQDFKVSVCDGIECGTVLDDKVEIYDARFGNIGEKEWIVDCLNGKPWISDAVYTCETIRNCVTIFRNGEVLMTVKSLAESGVFEGLTLDEMKDMERELGEFAVMKLNGGIND